MRCVLTCHVSLMRWVAHCDGSLAQTLPITNYRFRESMGLPVTLPLLFQARLHAFKSKPSRQNGRDLPSPPGPARQRTPHTHAAVRGGAATCPALRRKDSTSCARHSVRGSLLCTH